LNDHYTYACAEDIAVDKSKRVVVNGISIAIFHLEDGYYAIDDTCPHQGASLAFGELTTGVIACPRHGALFNVRSGEVLSLPALCGVRSFPLEIREGSIYIDTSSIEQSKPGLLKLG
jgi:3-phenylpropionate/trans-cinnamate dioxygenase ferredoxin subunit